MRFTRLRVQWLNQALSFYSSSVLAESFVLRNPPPSGNSKALVEIVEIQYSIYKLKYEPFSYI